MGYGDAIRMHNAWISPAEEYLPICTRMDEQALVYYESPYIICRSHAVANHYCSWLGFGRTFDPGTSTANKYQWKAKAANAVTNAFICVGGFEMHHGWGGEGLIAIVWDGSSGKWESWTSTGGNYEKTEITGVTFTDENTFRVEWKTTSAEVKFYVNDVLKATHSTYIPTTAMQLLAEVGTLGSAPASEPFSYFRAQSFKQV